MQVPQPTSAQVDWAISKAVSGGLTGGQGRAANFDHLGFAAYSPSTDFKLPALAGGAGAPLPREVLEGIFAQESNYNQASWHAAAGVPGDPLIADYYGFTASGGDYIDYDQADCGYGLGQLTTMMTNSQTASITLAKQQKVAVDFAENTAAAAQVLATTWNTLAADGITAGAEPERDRGLVLRDLGLQLRDRADRAIREHHRLQPRAVLYGRLGQLGRRLGEQPR